MAKQLKKQDLPRKICAGCGRPFQWRKKWAANWNEVRYCSKRCGGDARRKRTHGIARDPR